MRRRWITAALVAAGVLGGAGWKIVRADGIPSGQALYYSGTLTEGGAPVSGARSLVVRLWANPAPVPGETPLCQTPGGDVTVVSGRFRVPLGGDCTTQVGNNSSTYVEVVDNGTSLGRTAVGAVPYAVEANHAVNADRALDVEDGGTLAASLQALGAAIPTVTAWAPYTPQVLVSGLPLATSTAAYWRRVGDSIDVQIYTQFDGCGAGGELKWSLPGELVIDTTKSVLYQTIGSGMASIPMDADTGLYTLVVTSQGSSNLIAVDLDDTTPGGTPCEMVGPEGTIRMTFTAPIAGWTVNGP